jgi:predicted dehydrogenase
MTRARGSRRRFLAVASSAMAGPMFMSASARGANDRINIGVIGAGKQGEYHARYLARFFEDVRVVAVCDCYDTWRDTAVMLVNSDTGQEVCTGYRDFRQMLARPDLDAVLIATPDHWHAILAIAAARAGKDIYCEKPLSLTIAEAQAMVTATRRYDVVFQTGSQQRSDEKFRYACELVRNGFLGDLKTIHVNIGGSSVDCNPWRPYHSDLRPPHNLAFPNWRNYRDYSGGMMTDWGAHHFDIAQWAMDMDGSGPVEVLPPDGRQITTLTYRYANGVLLHRGRTPGVTPEGVRFTGTRGWIDVSRGRLIGYPANVIRRRIPAGGVQLYRSPGHHRDWLNCIRSRRRPICDVQTGASTAIVCHIGNIATWLGRPLRWNPRACRFDRDDQANRMLDRARREPWTL